MTMPRAFSYFAETRWRRLVLAMLFALSLAYSYFTHLVPWREFDPLVGFGIALYLIVFFFGCSYLLLGRIEAWGFGVYSAQARRLWMLGAFFAGAFFVVVLPLRPPKLPIYHTVEIAPTGQKNALAQGSETWVYGILQPNASGIPFTQFAVGAGWITKDVAVVAVGDTMTVARWQGFLEPDAEVRLLSHPWSGIVKVTIDGQSQTIDLYNATSTMRRIIIPYGNVSASAISLDVFLGFVDALSLSLIILTITLLLVRLPGAGIVLLPNRWSWFYYALPCIGVWFVYLLAFWPGFMSADSINQWQQMTTLRLVNNHPAFHTLTNWVITRLWFSPAAIAIVQILVLATVVGLTMTELNRWGVPTWARVLSTALFCISPAISAMVITLWKDIFYSAALLALFTLILVLVRTRGIWLRRPKSVIIFVAVLLAVALYRQNGIPVAAITLVVIIVVLPNFRRLALIAATGWVVGMLFVSMLLFSALGVVPTQAYYTRFNQIHQMAAFIYDGVALTSADVSLLNTIKPLPAWKASYNCYSINPTLWAPPFDYAAFTRAERDFGALWLRLAREHPFLLAQHLACASSLVWRVVPANDSYVYTIELGIVENSLGLSQQPEWPAAHDVLQDYLLAFANNALRWWWSPALYLYVGLAGLVVSAIKMREPLMLVPGLVPLINSLVLIPLIPTQDMRYQLGIMLIGMVAPTLVLARRPSAVPTVVAYEASPSVMKSPTIV